MEPTLFSFIWKYSKRQQFFLLLLTVLTFPFLYASLELPKRIINDAIGAVNSTKTLWGVELTQVQYLMLLCFAFLAVVLIGGLMKMRINTMKGVLSERMLRRLRYTLIARMMRFPKPYFNTTSQGELVSMVTSEAEPMGGLMGDAIAQPAFQAGQMLTIVSFLFLQSVWFGLASVALIPLQAWLIPRLQRQINLLNKERIHEVRKLSSEIGESAAGISDLRANGGWRFRLAQITDRLGRLFEIRYRIYQKKFFMKFLNNLITQMTPFLFYAVGGYLAIKGEITVGALVAALGAYKDLSAPWKELLTYYNQVQDMSLRWQVVTERFAPRHMIPEDLFSGEPAEIPHLDGSIELRNVTVRDQDGNTVLEEINLTIPPGSRVAVQSSRAGERVALAQLLTREVLPVSGEVLVSGRRLSDLHQAVIAARIGHAHSRPYLFDGALGDNLLMPLRTRPQNATGERQQQDKAAVEARKSGNSTDSLEANWIDLDLAGMDDAEEIRDWWFKLVQAMGTDEIMFRRTLRSHFDMALHPDLAKDIVRLRPEIRERLQKKGLDEAIFHFEPDQFNPAVPLGGNLLYASTKHEISTNGFSDEDRFVKLLDDQGLAEEAFQISLGVISTLKQAFGRDGTDHPLFRRLGMDPDMYRSLVEIADRRESHGPGSLTKQDRAKLLTVPFLLSAEQIGPSFPEEYKDKILQFRKSQSAKLLKEGGSLFFPISPDVFIPQLTVIENAIYGRVSLMAGARADEIEDLVAEVLSEQGMRRRIAAVVYDLPAGLGGTNLPTVFQERAAFSRAAIKRPDILILDRALASHDSQSRVRTRQKLRELLPNSIMIFMEDQFAHPEAYDLFVEIRDGRIDGVERERLSGMDHAGTADLKRKLDIIASTELFSRLDPRNQRLLAFSAQWYDAKAGQVIFLHNQPADAAYLCLTGKSALRWPESAPDDPPLSFVEPGRLIGDLSIITGDPRPLDLIALEDSGFLRIGAEEFRAVIENDATVAVRLLETVAGHLVDAADFLRDSHVNIAEFTNPMGDPIVGEAEPDKPQEGQDA
ncbi:ABC transporter transmembrane domain-containing protein [Primorskyibacter sp. S87]|uniref:ABC transporter transmembrane domain-containing protein n=1 Tax=Primorskyibacter sp. S87 TaxID=3415126 RepID=UPI003C7CA9D8